MNNHPLISVIIPTLNSEKTIEECLNSIRNQTYTNIDIIVVDGGSQDRTLEIITNYHVKIIESNIRSITKQTNLGIGKSQGKYIYRVDSDVILPPTIVEECVFQCEIEGYDGVCVFWLPDDSISFWAKVRKIEKEANIKNPHFVGSKKYDKNILGARFLKREVLDSVGGLNEEIINTGEDYDLYNKLAQTDYVFALIESTEKHIGEPRTVKDIIKKNFKYGIELKHFLDSQKDGGRQYSPFGRNYLTETYKNTFKNDLTIFFGLITYSFMVYSSATMGLIYYMIIRPHKK